MNIKIQEETQEDILERLNVLEKKIKLMEKIKNNPNNREVFFHLFDSWDCRKDGHFWWAGRKWNQQITCLICMVSKLNECPYCKK